MHRGKPRDHLLVRVPQEFEVVFGQSLTQERLGEPDGVDVAALELARHLREVDLGQSEGVGIAAVLCHRLHDGQVALAVEHVDSYVAALQVVPAFDVIVGPDHDAVDVIALGVGVGVSGQQPHVQALVHCSQHREGVAHGEVHIAGLDSREHGGRALPLGDLHVEAMVFEDAFVQPVLHGGRRGDVEHPQADISQLSVIGGVPVASAGGQCQGQSCDGGSCDSGLGVHSEIPSM